MLMYINTLNIFTLSFLLIQIRENRMYTCMHVCIKIHTHPHTHTLTHKGKHARTVILHHLPEVKGMAAVAYNYLG